MQSIEYRIGTWDSEKWGNHRVLIKVESEDKIVGVRIPWRRPDLNPEAKGVFILSAETGDSVDNIFIKEISGERGLIAFEPVSGQGLYEVYYMKYEGTTRAPYPVISYVSQPEPADEAWQKDAERKWPGLSQASVEAFEASDPLHSFYPMEVAASFEEVEELIRNEEGRNFLIFPETRENSIRMRKNIPFHWIDSGAFADFHGDADRGEFFVFQLGLFAHKNMLEHITLSFSDLKAKGISRTIQSSDMTCFNQEGISFTGESFTKELTLPEKEVQPLWIGIQIGDDAVPGQYAGSFTVSTKNSGEEKIKVIIDVHSRKIEARGDDEPERMSRLRWLNSTLGSDDSLIKPYIPVGREGMRLTMLGRDVQIGKNCLPSSINIFFTPEVTGICEEPFPVSSSSTEFIIQGTGTGEVKWDFGQVEFIDDIPNTQRFRQKNRTESFTQKIEGILEPDGCMEYSIALEALESIELDDTVLRIPFEEHTVKYILGLGFQGGIAPLEWTWKWDTKNRNQDSIWIGSEQGGLQISLKDDNYRRPLNTNFYRLQPLVSPVSWDNEGKGSISFGRNSRGLFILSCSGGSRLMKKGDILHFNFRILITPFRPIDTEKQWNTRFYHRYNSPEEIKKTGANTVNLHHATPVNPFINYPFLRPAEFKEYADKVHDLGMKIRLYYTVRELTNHAPEIFALKSLGDEIFTDGPGGGHSWLQEHFRENYIAAWHVFEYGCVAVANSGNSRWHNFYVEGLDWLARNMEIDGVYIDDLAFDRQIMKRVRRVLDQHRNGAIIDLHSANQFNEKDGFANSINMYMEHLPYIDKIWLGEYFDYSRGPDYWMTEVAGLPFGTMGEMLQDGGHLWRGMLYGMTSRYPHEKGDPRAVWKVWEEFGMTGCRMLGYWTPECPVRTSNNDILATVYRKRGRILISLASWADEDVELNLSVDWEKLEMDRSRVSLRTPFMEGFQEARSYSPEQSILIRKNEGALIIAEEG